MKKAAAGLVVFALALSGLCLSLNFLAERGVRRVFSWVQGASARERIDIRRLSYQEAAYSLPLTLHLVGVRMELTDRNHRLLPEYECYDARIEKVRVALKGWHKTVMELSLHGITVSLAAEEIPEGAPVPGKQDVIRAGNMSLALPVFPWAPEKTRSEMKKSAREVTAFFRTGRAVLPIDFSGTVSWPRGNGAVRSRVAARRAGEWSVLVMEREDVKGFSREFHLKTPLTDREIDLVADNPLKAHRLLSIKTSAREKSEKAYAADHSVPEDAYRHVLWSYLLAREYGKEFAKEVTDAHEEGQTGNTAPEREMDIENNRLGMEYAAAGYAEENLLPVLLSDNRVVRSPKEAAPSPGGVKGRE